MLKTINSLEQLLTGENMDRGKIKMVLFDIDGTLAESKLIKDILFRTLEEFNISERVIPKLGKEIVNEKWLTNKLGLSEEKAIEIMERYEDHFFEITGPEFKGSLFDDVEGVFKELFGEKIIIGIFTLRKVDLATHQMILSGLEPYIAKSSGFPNSQKLQISGSCIDNKISADGLEEKIHQLKLHLEHNPGVSLEEITVVGDSLETDIKAASILNLKNILIDRRE